MSATEQPDGPPVLEYGRAARMRVAVAEAAAELADSARGLVPTNADSWGHPGSLTEHARGLVAQAQYVLDLAVTTDRFRGASWEAIGEALGEVSRQAAHERYAAAEKGYGEALLLAWLTGRTAGVPAGAVYPAESAALLDRWVAEHLHSSDPLASRDVDNDERRRPVSIGLPPMDVIEHIAMVTAATRLLQAGPDADPAERQALEVGQLRRRVELYERLAEDDGHARRAGIDPETLGDLLAGARARLAELQGDQLAERRARARPGAAELPTD